MTIRSLAGVLILLLTSFTPGQGPRWSERFPAIAGRIPHLDQRLADQDAATRIGVLRELTYFRPRDSKAYPPFLAALLEDPSSDVRGEAIELLWEHHVFLKLEQLPDSFSVPFLGEIHWKDPVELERVREMALRPDTPEGGWALHVLGLLDDLGSIPLARALLESKNVFVRHSAAVVLVQLGQREVGLEALRALTGVADDESGYYRCRAAEDLVRFGEREAVDVLIDLMEAGSRAGYANGPREILEDLTGQYFTTAVAARTWVKQAVMSDWPDADRHHAAPLFSIPPRLVGPGSFPIVDQQVNPGCHYQWTLQAGSAAITLTGGRMIIRASGSMPLGTFYTWKPETVQHVFGSGNPRFNPGEKRTSAPYATTGKDVQSFDFDTEFDYVDEYGESGIVRQSVSCIRDGCSESASRNLVSCEPGAVPPR
jgi:hypothetical protein